MNKELFKEIITRQNHTFEKEKSLVTREIFPKIEALTHLPHIVVISGLRRVGKSTLLKQIKKQFYDLYQNIYLNFEDEKLLGFWVADFDVLLETFFPLNQTATTYFFDEIQNIEQFELALRRLYDEGYKFYITGSNASLLSQELGTRLTGRYTKIGLYPFSFREFLDFHQIERLEEVFYFPEKRAKIQHFFDIYLQNGGLPEYVQYGNEETVKQVYDDIVYRDILVRYGITDKKAFKELSRYLISNITSEFSYTKLKNLLGFWSVNTVKSYIHFLENSYLLFQVERFDYSVKKQILNNKKIYCIDNAFYNLVGFSFSANSGQRLENLVFIELKRRGYEIFYHREKKECDFLLRERWGIIWAIQVSWSLSDPDTRNREIAGLLEALELYHLREGIILTRDEEELIEWEKHTIRVIPIWKWLLDTMSP